MKQIANILIDYGFDFDYENRNSNGETIIAHQIDLKVSTYQGTVFFEHDGESEEFEENENALVHMVFDGEKMIFPLNNLNLKGMMITYDVYQ